MTTETKKIEKLYKTLPYPHANILSPSSIMKYEAIANVIGE